MKSALHPTTLPPAFRAGLAVSIVALVFQPLLLTPVTAGDSLRYQRDYAQRARKETVFMEAEANAPATGRAGPTEKATTRAAVVKIAKAVDKIAADLEEFGTVSMSSPLLTLPTSTLSFGLQNGASQYYTNARTEVAGRALAATAIQQSLGVGVQAAADLDQLATGRSLTAQVALQLAANRELEASKQKRAQLAYNAVKQRLPRNATEQEKTQNELDAETARANVLKEDSGAKDPTFPKTTADNTIEAKSAAGQVSTTVTVVEDKSKPIMGPDGKPLEGQFQTTTTTTSTSNSTPSEVAPRVDPALVALAAIDASHTAVGRAGQAFLGGEIKLPDLDAIKAAESATSLEGLTNFFHSPTDAMQFRDKIVMMGAVTVSVMPGWRTRKEWAGEVVMVNKYNFVTARREVVARMINDPDLPTALKKRLARDYDLPWTNTTMAEMATLQPRSGGTSGTDSKEDQANTSASKDGLWVPPHLRYNEAVQMTMLPLVSGISPLMQSDTLDLASEFRRQDQFALALAVTLRQQGAKGEAKVFEQFVKNQKKDVQTRSTSATVATYSRAGGVVGFQIGPRLKALEDPSSRKNKSAFVLERQAFPALLVYGLDAADIYPRIKRNADGILTVYEPKIHNTQRSYWQPTTYRYQGPKDCFNPFKFLWPPIWWEPALKRDRLAQRAMDWHDATYDAGDVLGKCGDRQIAAYNWGREFQASGDELIRRSIGAFNDQYLPAEVLVPLGRVPLPKAPEVTVRPHIRTVQPDFKSVTTPPKDDANPAPVPPVVELVYVGEGLDAVSRIGCRHGEDVVEYSAVRGKKGDTATQILPNVIVMQVRVKKSVALQFELYSAPLVVGGAPIAGSALERTPAVSVVVDGAAPIAGAPVAPLEIRAPRIATVPPALQAADDGEPDPAEVGEPSLALIPEPLPTRTVAKRPRR